MVSMREKLNFVVSLLLLLTGESCSLVIRETKQLGRFSQFEVRRITNAIPHLILKLANNPSYTAGRSFTSTLMATNSYKATVRLWFFSIAPSKNRVTCSVSPDHAMVLSYSVLQQEYYNIFKTVYEQSQARGYGSMMVVSKVFAIQYISWEGKLAIEELESLGNAFANVSASPAVADRSTLDDLDDCWPFSTGMISGYQTEGSYVFGPYIFRSKNNRYEASFKSQCNFILYDYGDPKSYVIKPRVVWESKSDTKDRYAYCSISLQVDSNLLIAKNYKNIPQFVFASDKYCKPQPDCVRTAGFSVEDNGYVVVWETDTQTELWREPVT